MVTDDEHVLGRGGHWQNSDALIGSFTVLVWWWLQQAWNDGQFMLHFSISNAFGSPVESLDPLILPRHINRLVKFGKFKMISLLLLSLLEALISRWGFLSTKARQRWTISIMLLLQHADKWQLARVILGRFLPLLGCPVCILGESFPLKVYTGEAIITITLEGLDEDLEALLLLFVFKLVLVVPQILEQLVRPVLHPIFVAGESFLGRLATYCAFLRRGEVVLLGFLTWLGHRVWSLLWRHFECSRMLGVAVLRHT